MPWGNSKVTGRGLLALAGKGQIYSIDLKAGEQYIVHPRYVHFMKDHVLFHLTIFNQQCCGIHDDAWTSKTLSFSVPYTTLPDSGAEAWEMVRWLNLHQEHGRV